MLPPKTLDFKPSERVSDAFWKHRGRITQICKPFSSRTHLPAQRCIKRDVDYCKHDCGE